VFRSAAQGANGVGYARLKARYSNPVQTGGVEMSSEANLTVVWLRRSGNATDFLFKLPYRGPVQKQPLRFNPLVQLIDAYTRLNKVEQAEALIPPDLSPADAATLQFNIAVNYVRIKRWAEAEEHFKRVMELNPQLPVTHKYLGEVYLNMDKHAEALKELEAYVAAAPDAPDAAETKEVIEALRKMAKHKK